MPTFPAYTPAAAAPGGGGPYKHQDKQPHRDLFGTDSDSYSDGESESLSGGRGDNRRKDRSNSSSDSSSGDSSSDSSDGSDSDSGRGSGKASKRLTLSMKGRKWKCTPQVTKKKKLSLEDDLEWCKNNQVKCKKMKDVKKDKKSWAKALAELRTYVKENTLQKEGESHKTCLMRLIAEHSQWYKPDDKHEYVKNPAVQISYTDAVNLTLKELKGNSTPAAAPASAKGGGGIRHSRRNRDQESVVTGVSSVASSASRNRPSRRVQMGDLEFR